MINDVLISCVVFSRLGGYATAVRWLAERIAGYSVQPII